MTRRAIFLDRDGVINAEGGKFVTRPEDLRLLPGTMKAIAALTRSGWPVFVYTNQSGVGRGYMTMRALDAVHTHLQCEIAAAGGELCGVYACPHHPEAGCECRKPKPGLLLQAAREHNINLGASYALGDSPRDIAAAHAAGCRTVLVLSGHTKVYESGAFPAPQPAYVVQDLPTFAQWLLDPPSMMAPNATP